MEEHIFSAGEQRLRDTAQQDLSAAFNLLGEPLQTNDVHDALRKARAATAALEYLDRRASGCPEPRRGGRLMNRKERKGRKFMELNPNHKVVRQAHDHWHKIAALIMVTLGKTELQITRADVDKIAHGNVNIMLDARGEAKTGILTIRIVDDKTAAEMVRKEGGRAMDS